MTDLVVHSAETLVVGPGDQQSLQTLTDGTLVVEDGRISAVGPTDQLRSEYPVEAASRTIDASGQTVLPGFVDPHTHALFAGDRSEEFVAKIEGKSYTDIMAEGGGIPVTVEAVREASTETLVENLCANLDTMLAHGTTTAEVKSGYGLDTETELRMLDAIEQADERHPVDLVATFMGAHEIPQEQSVERYTEEVIEKQLPAVAEQEIGTFCDVFCEEGVFDVEQSRRILQAGREHGLEPKIHAEEFSRLGGTQLAAELGAVSADHLLKATQEDARALADADVVPTLLPGAAFTLSEPYADPDQFLRAGSPVALGTDLNPSCFVHSMPFIISLACLEMGMTPDQALRGATHSAALALDGDGETGTLAEGTPADIVIADLPSHIHLAANAGTDQIETVIKDGEIVVENTGGQKRD